MFLLWWCHCVRTLIQWRAFCGPFRVYHCFSLLSLLLSFNHFVSFSFDPLILVFCAWYLPGRVYRGRFSLASEFDKLSLVITASWIPTVCITRILALMVVLVQSVCHLEVFGSWLSGSFRCAVETFWKGLSRSVLVRFWVMFCQLLLVHINWILVFCYTWFNPIVVVQSRCVSFRCMSGSYQRVVLAWIKSLCFEVS